MLQEIVNDQGEKLRKEQELNGNLNRANIEIELANISNQFEKVNNELLNYKDIAKRMVPKLIEKANKWDESDNMINSYLNMEVCDEMTWEEQVNAELMSLC